MSFAAISVYIGGASYLGPAISAELTCRPEPVYQTDAEVAAAYADAVFAVRLRSPGNCESIKSVGKGTAFLIDRRGYFLTASHNLQLNMSWLSKDARAFSETLPDGFDDHARLARRGQNVCPPNKGKKGPIVLSRGEHVKLEAVEVACGNPGPGTVDEDILERAKKLGISVCEQGNRDFSILKVLNTDDSGTIRILQDIRNVPDIATSRAELAKLPQDLVMLGFPQRKCASGDAACFDENEASRARDPAAAGQRMTPRSPRSTWTDQDQFLVTEGYSSPGFSGGLLLDRQGIVWGIHAGPETQVPRYGQAAQECEKSADDAAADSVCQETGLMLFTRASSIIRPLSVETHLVPDAKTAVTPGETLLAALRKGVDLREEYPLDYRTARLGRLSRFEAYRVIEEILSEDRRKNNPYAKGMSVHPYEVMNVARCARDPEMLLRLGVHFDRLGISLEPKTTDARADAIVLADAMSQYAPQIEQGGRLKVPGPLGSMSLRFYASAFGPDGQFLDAAPPDSLARYAILRSRMEKNTRPVGPSLPDAAAEAMKKDAGSPLVLIAVASALADIGEDEVAQELESWAVEQAEDLPEGAVELQAEQLKLQSKALDRLQSH